MKIKAKTAFHYSGQPVKLNAELDLPEATARSLIANGLATEIGQPSEKKKAPAKKKPAGK